MEARAHKLNMLVAPRKMNACELFPHIHYLISDQSSLLGEFIPFGIPIETGRYDDNPDHIDYQMSDIFKGIYKYQYIGDIMELPKIESSDVTYDSNRHYGKEIADAIRDRI
jgi:CDP-glycerol glycerophosphotransferase (TagB/SpsB family)